MKSSVNRSNENGLSARAPATASATSKADPLCVVKSVSQSTTPPRRRQKSAIELATPRPCLDPAGRPPLRNPLECGWCAGHVRGAHTATALAVVMNLSRAGGGSPCALMGACAAELIAHFRRTNAPTRHFILTLKAETLR